MTNTKSFFWENKADVEDLQKRSPNNSVSCKFFLKSENSLNWILWGTEYRFNTLKFQIRLNYTKPFFCENKGNIEYLQKRSPNIWVLCQFILKSVKTLTRISWATESWFRALNCQLWLTNTKPFFWGREGNVETLQKPALYIGVSYKFVLKSDKSLNRILWAT